MIQKLSNDVWKIELSSNVYFLDMEKKIIIDTGTREDRAQLKCLLNKIIPLEKIDLIIFTHLHYDHIGNTDLFPNAQLYASKEAIEDFLRDPKGTVLRTDIAAKITKEFLPIESLKIPGLEFVKTPGHTRGSICIWYEQEKILFSGDTLFFSGYGRTDFPTSVFAQYQDSLMKLTNYNYKILAPGHE